VIERLSEGTIASMYRLGSSLAVLLAPLLSMSGCEEPMTCTTEAVASVQLDVVDAETGDPVEATVTFLLDGDGPREPEFESGPGSYVLASETEGTFVVTIAADGYETVMREYVVTADECHVETVTDEVALVPTA
jgi:hypothetical protein